MRIEHDIRGRQEPVGQLTDCVEQLRKSLNTNNGKKTSGTAPDYWMVVKATALGPTEKLALAVVSASRQHRRCPGSRLS
jgi:hypothetical protein